MKKTCLSNSRLYITEDIYHDNVWFVRTDIEQIARLKMEQGWQIYFYPYRINLKKEKLDDSLRLIEKMFKEYWKSKYGESKCDIR